MPVNEKLIAQVDAVTGIYDRGRNILDMTAPFTIRLNTGLTPSASRCARTSASVTPPVICFIASWTTPEPRAVRSLPQAHPFDENPNAH